jgi:pimeloyl-ACP methyl ester carboxylesterase
MEKLLLLHGATGSKAHLQSLDEALSDTCETHAIDFAGHGDAITDDYNFSIEKFADQVFAYITQLGESVHIFGYSMGGYVALHFAKKHPELVKSIITLGTKLYWSSEIAVKESAMLNAEKLEEKAPAYIESLKKIHTRNNCRDVLSGTQKLMKHLGDTNLLLEEDVSTISCPTLLMLGDKDKMVSLEETLNVFKQLPNAKMAVLPGTPHLIDKVNINLLSFHILHHLKAQ